MTFQGKCYLGGKNWLLWTFRRFVTIKSSKNSFGGGLEVKMAKIHFSRQGPIYPKNRDFEVLSYTACYHLKGRLKNLRPRQPLTSPYVKIQVIWISTTSQIKAPKTVILGLFRILAYKSLFGIFPNFDPQTTPKLFFRASYG